VWLGTANFWGVERAEAEAVYGSGREACVEFLMRLMAAQERLEERVRVLEAESGASSRNSSVALSADTAMSRQERRALARAKTKELLKKDGERRKAGGQPGHRGSGRELLGEDQMSEIVDHYPSECSGCGHKFTEVEKGPAVGRRASPGRRVAPDHCRVRRASCAPVALPGLQNADPWHPGRPRRLRVRADPSGGASDVDRS
jgi:hypothetical protein